jgi:hypothetical protein
MRRLLLLTTSAFVALTGTSQATIVPQEGMLGAKLRQTVSQVRDKLGPPDGIVFVNNEIIGRQRVYRYGKTTINFDGDGRDARVITFSTTSRRERTANDVGVGSRRATVDRKVARSTCKVEFGVDHCYVGSFRPGRRVTDFLIGSRGRVTRVVVGIVID